MTARQRYNLQRAFRKHYKPKNGTTFRNAINQTAHQHKTSERKVHAAICPNATTSP